MREVIVSQALNFRFELEMIIEWVLKAFVQKNINYSVAEFS